MVLGLLALAAAALFSGAAFYVGFAEHPARLALDERAQLAQWRPAYRRGALMQASLAVIGFLLGAAAWWQSGELLWLAGAIVLAANWPYTMLFITPTNDALKALSPAETGPESRALLVRRGRLHLRRTILGGLATVLFLWAALS